MKKQFNPILSNDINTFLRIYNSIEDNVDYIFKKICNKMDLADSFFKPQIENVEIVTNQNKYYVKVEYIIFEIDGNDKNYFNIPIEIFESIESVENFIKKFRG
jgi:hypothetical protein